MKIFDRWGGMIYAAYGIPLNMETLGWDGMYNGKVVNSGVYGYMFQISFLDNVIFTYSGDINVVR